MKEHEKPQLIYLLPNLFTAASAFVGVISVLATVGGNYWKAIMLILLSLILDGLDGRVARLTKTTSKFGVEFDSLADIIAFGVAPAMLFYYSIGHQFGKVGSLVTAMFVVFGAVRLARFNVTTGTYEPSVFIGLPIPTAAIACAFWVGFYIDYDFMKGYEILYLICVAMLSLLMVSNIRYPSFKKIDFKKANFMKVFISLIIIFSIIYVYPLEFAVGFTTVYIFYGIIRAIYTVLLSKFRKKTYNVKNNPGEKNE